MQHMRIQKRYDDEGKRFEVVPVNINTVDGLKTHQLGTLLIFVFVLFIFEWVKV